MILRPRQEQFKIKCVGALKKRKNTLGIAPTGAGKTVMLSSVIAGFPGAASLVLQHRDELVDQNEKTYRRFVPGAKTSFYTADYKRFGPAGTPTFAMVQTLSRPKNLAEMPRLDFVGIDEAHHTAADSYIKIIERAKQLNPDVMIFGVTATPSRGDARNLRATWDNVADQITLGELIRDRLLVKPRCFVIETGTRDELKGVRKTANDFDMQAVEAIMNTRVINEKIVEKWREHAGTRQTVAFCSTVQHARDLMAAFVDAGVSCGLVHGDMPDAERKDTLARYDRGLFQVILNVAVLTEGWDHQPTSCVLLARPCSFKSTMIQMIGRGLRTVDPERYPGVQKDDCIVLDFGYSLLTHRDLEQAINLETDAGPKRCPECEATIPAAAAECAICGYEWPAPEDSGDANDPVGEAPEKELVPLEDFVMTEFDLMAKSPFRWEDFFNGAVTVANALDAWAVVINFRGRWVAVGGADTLGMRVIVDSGDRLLALSSADDFLREHGDDKTARKSKRWVTSPPSDKQLQFLGVAPMAAIGLNRYRASCAITWKKMERAIKARLLRLNPQPAAA